MKIERAQLKAALLAVAGVEYAGVPAEDHIDYAFSQAFRQKAKELNTKSQRKSWRCWNVYRRRVILIAVIVALLLMMVSCVPYVQKLFVSYDFVDHGKYYGIVVDQEKAATAPDKCETFYVPTWAPKGYELMVRSANMCGVTYIWMSGNDQYIAYNQTTLPNGTSDSWYTIDSEQSIRSTRSMNGYIVELFAWHTDAEYCQMMAVWTDNEYLYDISITIREGNGIKIIDKIMDSLEVAETVECFNNMPGRK